MVVSRQKLISHLSLTLNVHHTHEIKSFCFVLYLLFVSIKHHKHDKEKKKREKSNDNDDICMYIMQLLESKIRSVLLTTYEIDEYTCIENYSGFI